MKKLDLSNIDRTFWGLFITLIVVAIIALFSASSTLVYMHHSALGPIGQQMFFICRSICHSVYSYLLGSVLRIWIIGA